MNTLDVIKTKLEVKEYDSKRPVPKGLKMDVLEAGRLTASGMNSQHWRFILVQEKSRLNQLANDSTTGLWVANCAFAVIVLTRPERGFHLIDAGRAVQDMQLAAWDQGVASRVFTGIKEQELRKDFGIPKELEPTIVVGFGYPKEKLTGRKKDRAPLEEIVFIDTFGNKLDGSKVT